MIYALLAVSTGLPGMIAGGLACVELLWFSGLSRLGMGDPFEALLSVLWGGAGLAGIIAWLWLSACFFRPAPPDLTNVHRAWWWLLAIGVLAALPALVAAVWALAHRQLEGLALLWFGPALLPCSALLWRWRRS